MKKTNDIDINVKERAEEILSVLGISPEEAVNIFYEQIILHNGMPFGSSEETKNPLDCGGEAHSGFTASSADVPGPAQGRAERFFSDGMPRTAE